MGRISTCSRTNVKTTRRSATKAAELKFYAPTAKKVNIAGTFNNWDIKKTTAKKDIEGNWIAKIVLKPGRYEYKFIVDGNWVDVPNGGPSVANDFGTQNYVIEVK